MHFVNMFVVSLHEEMDYVWIEDNKPHTNCPAKPQTSEQLISAKFTRQYNIAFQSDCESELSVVKHPPWSLVLTASNCSSWWTVNHYCDRQGPDETVHSLDPMY